MITHALFKKMEKAEGEYRADLIEKLLVEINAKKSIEKKPDIQMIFCIDVRSEPFRRQIEKLGNYETIGFAGFFGLPVQYKQHSTEKPKISCPVLIEPKFKINEELIKSNGYSVKTYKKFKNLKKKLSLSYKRMKCNVATPFPLVESLGIFTALIMIYKSTYLKGVRRFIKHIKKVLLPEIKTQPCIDVDLVDKDYGIPTIQQIKYAESTLKLMGFNNIFGKYVVICGHKSTNINNAYASSLNCGACGGNEGGDNAKILANILNKASIRKSLKSLGIIIPSETVFLGAIHDTSTDSVELYNIDETEKSKDPILSEFIANLSKTKAILNESKIEEGDNIRYNNSINRSTDWSETRPEWGLARNAGFVIAPRKITTNIDLNSRCFLHSYNYETDQDGSGLETILTAPMIVAQWINAQYLFSTLDNVKYGSGSKITHNIIGRIGVIQGNGSDLMHGLPLQSVMSSDDVMYHIPQRLLVIVYASKKTVNTIIEKQIILQNLFFNEWLFLVVIDPIENIPYLLKKDNTWHQIKWRINER